MKFLMILFVLTNFLSATKGLECYLCWDYAPHSSSYCTNPTTMNCSDSPIHDNQYCATYSFDKEHEYFKNCKGNCLMKSCVTSKTEQKCKISETFELSNSDGVSAKVSCCQGDLCNGLAEDSNSSNKLSNQNILFYAFLFNYIICLV